MLMLGLKGLRSEENVDNNNYTVNSLLDGHLWSWHKVSVQE